MLPVVLALLAGLWLVPASSTFADPPKPKLPDSRARLKPKDAELTTSVEPAEAKPGETVTFKVTAKLDPGYHIYKYTKEKPMRGAGPVYTTFDFFDTAGLQGRGGVDCIQGGDQAQGAGVSRPAVRGVSTKMR